MGSRNVLTLLIVVFVAVLLYNVLYFTGIVGSFGSTNPLAPLPQDNQLNVPGMQRQPTPQSSAPRPQPSATPSGGGRRAVTTAELTLTADWGRNPFFTPGEIWALANYRPVYVTEPGASGPATGLVLNAIVMDSTGRRVAVINNDVIAIGDQVAGMTVVDMQSDAVVFRLAGGERHVVRMADAAIGLSVRGGSPRRY